MSRLGALAALTAALLSGLAPTAAGAVSERATLHASFSPDRLGAPTTISFGFHDETVEGTAPGQFGLAESIAVAPGDGDVYVTDVSYGESNGEFAVAQRIEAFTSTGGFVEEIGKEVNETTKGNHCSQEEIENSGVKCKAAALRTPTEAEASSEPGAFNFESQYGNLLAFGGPQDLLYVGDQGRVQEFKVAGIPAGEVSLAAISTTGKATAVTVDPTGDVFVSDSETAGVREYNAGGVLQPQVIDAVSIRILALALAPNGRVVIIDRKETESGRKTYGLLYNASGTKISEFAPPSGGLPGLPVGAAFAVSGALYLAEQNTFEVEAYTPVVFPETRTCPAEEVLATTAKLCGEINPDGVQTTGFFQYGTSTSLGSQTPVVFEGMGEAFAPVSSLTELAPNQSYHYKMAAEAEVNGEKLVGTGEEATFHTATLPPQILGAPSTSFLGAQSADLTAALNPENTTTHYHFEYGPCASLTGCAGIKSTTQESSAAYGQIPTTAEISELAPATTYSYRLVASNRHIASCEGGYPFEEEGEIIRCEEGGVPVYAGGEATGPEAQFTTGPAPVVQAATGAPSAVTATSATISGAVNPDGEPATYTFELGVYAGAATQYGVVVSGSVPAETTPVEETLPLSGLQPGTTYAYRIAIHSGYGTAEGASVTFTTAGLPSVLVTPAPLAMLAIPNIAFPAETKPLPSKKLTRAQRLARALKACTKQPKRKRPACRQRAHQKYGPTKKKK
jgi:hypothetical protein